MKKPEEITIVIGRFQPCTAAHVELFKSAIQETNSKTLLILVGSANVARSIKNPFTFKERKEMIMKCIEEIKIKYHILPINDSNYNDVEWMQGVCNKVCDFYPKAISSLDLITLYGYEKDDSSYYLKKLKNYSGWNLSLGETPFRENLSATDVRNNLFQNNKNLADYLELVLLPPVSEIVTNFMNSETYEALRKEWEFVEKYKNSWKTAPYPPVFVTGDALVIWRDQVLLGMRGKDFGKGLWCLPGGFLDQKDKSILHGVLRELREETNIRILWTDAFSIGDKEYQTRNILTSTEPDFYQDTKNMPGRFRWIPVCEEVFDAVGRDYRGRVISHCFMFRIPDKYEVMVDGGDDLSGAGWVDLKTALDNPTEFFLDHYKILNYMLTKEKTICEH
jgi:bifunctional NMN adenylyltransferase/nudix hydrolase